MTRMLSTIVEDEISKGVELPDCLSGFGRYWTGEITGGLGTSDSKVDVAKSVTQIDDFLSHDWSTWGKLKFITLCFHYNSSAAAVISLVVAFICGVLQIYVPNMRLMPSYHVKIAGVDHVMDSAGHFGWLMGNISFIFVLFLGQRIRRCLRFKTRVVFMDKLCIHQTNPDLKAKGILGLYGFLNMADRLVILWSPRYFTRLWCVYELASWIHQGKPLRDVAIRPVAEGFLMVYGYLGFLIFTGVIIPLAQLDDTILRNMLASVMCFVVTLPLLHVMRRAVRDLRKIPCQINNFAFDSAQCFCCNVSHVIPGTDIEIPCDRDIISHKLNTWFDPGEVQRRASAASSSSDPANAAGLQKLNAFANNTAKTSNEDVCPIEVFEGYVRIKFGKHILKRIGGSKVCYANAFICSLPGWMFVCDRVHLLYVIGGWSAWRLVLYYGAITTSVFPNVMRLALKTAVMLDASFGVRENLFLDFLITILFSIPTAGPSLALLYILNVSVQAEHEILQVVVTFGCVVLCAFLFRKDLIYWCRNVRRCASSSNRLEGAVRASISDRSLDEASLPSEGGQSQHSSEDLPDMVSSDVSKSSIARAAFYKDADGAIVWQV